MRIILSSYIAFLVILGGVSFIPAVSSQCSQNTTYPIGFIILMGSNYVIWLMTQIFKQNNYFVQKIKNPYDESNMALLMDGEE